GRTRGHPADWPDRSLRPTGLGAHPRAESCGEPLADEGSDAVAGNARDLAAGVDACTAEVEVLDRRGAIGPSRQRALRVGLPGSVREVADIAVGQADPRFELLRTEHDDTVEALEEVRHELGDSSHRERGD